MVLPVIEDLVAEHGAHWVVADIIGNSNTTPGNIKKYLKILENLKRAWESTGNCYHYLLSLLSSLTVLIASSAFVKTHDSPRSKCNIILKFLTGKNICFQHFKACSFSILMNCQLWVILVLVCYCGFLFAANADGKYFIFNRIIYP